MTETMEQAEDAPQLTCKFVTKLPEELRVPQAALAVPSNLTRYGLSQIINHLLELDPPKPFDFLVNGELLRGTLQQQLASQGASVEVVTEIEYIPLQLPPTPGPSTPQDDWIASLVASDASSFYSGSYDGFVRLIAGGEIVRAFQLGTKPVKALARLPDLGLLTGDGSGAVALWSSSSHDKDDAVAPSRSATLQSDGEEVAALAFSPAPGLVAGGGWDKEIKLWDRESIVQAVAEGSQEEAPETTKKRRKERGSREAAAVAQRVVEPTSIFKGHKDAVSSLDWTRDGHLLSGSWDHTVALWDASTGSQVDALSCGKAVYAASSAPTGPAVAAIAGADLTIRLWDPRATGEAVAPQRLRGHQHWVMALAWHPTRAYLLASASLDGTARIWDTRASIPLHTLEPGSGKLLAAAWSGDELAIGGEGKQVHTFKL